MSIKVSGGGGGGGGYPGVTSDGQMPGGLTIAGALTAGDPNAPVFPSNHQINGFVFIADVEASTTDGDDLFEIHQGVPIPSGGYGGVACLIVRNGNISAEDYAAPVLQIRDNTASAQPLLQLKKQGNVVLEVGTPISITGALASVTDANAKAVLTSIIAALTSIKVAINNTT